MNLRSAHWTLKIEFEEKVLTFCLNIDSNKSDIQSDLVSKIVRTLSMHFKNRFIELEIDIFILT